LSASLRPMQFENPGLDIAFRYANALDVAAIVALVQSAYRGEVSRAGWATEADLLDGQRTDAEEVNSILNEADAGLLLATRNTELLACALLRREPSGAYIGMLAVRPDLQAMGVGKALLTEAEERAKGELHCKRARMSVIEQRKDLIAWYQRRGYTVTDRTEPFPYGNTRFGLPKRDDLRFVILEKSLA
jgi:ribosomal protein S18 acetylase RimI-like enzyme